MTKQQIVELANQGEHTPESMGLLDKETGGLGILTLRQGCFPVEIFQKRQRGFTMFKGWYVTLHETENADWGYYSKAWHRRYGPKVTIDRRYIKLRKKGRKPIEIDVERWAGNFLVKALVEHFQLEKVQLGKRVAKILGSNRKAVQLNPYYDVKFTCEKFGLRFFERTFGGETVDYCVLDQNGATCHASSPAKCVADLKAKRLAAARAEARRLEREDTVLTAEIARHKYGFCTTGIMQFAELNGLDPHGAYTIRQIRSAVLKNRSENCATYRSELRTIGITLNCKQQGLN